MDRFDAMSLIVPGLSPRLAEQFAGILRQIAHDEHERCTELLAEWMVNHGLATGHGDTMESLLKELEWQVAELRQKLQYAQQQSS